MSAELFGGRPLKLGELLGQRYRIDEHLSQGGMGVVFKAWDLVKEEFVAVKALRADRRNDALLARFRHEYYLMATLSHPRFVEVRDLVMARSGEPCLVMEYVEGDDLERLLPLRVEEAVQVIDQLSEALSFLHSRRYVHHDLKSSNVRIRRSEDGQISAKLIDFGIMESVGTVRRELAGTPAYLPPEVLFGAPTDPRLDLYSLGTLAFEILSGYVPFDISDAESFVQAKQVSPPDISKLLQDIPEDLVELVIDLMSADPLARPQDASVVRRRLRQFAPQLSEASHGVTPAYLKPSLLVGRESDFKRLLNSWDLLKDNSALFSVVGTAGSGKSALLKELGLRIRLRGGATELVFAGSSSGPFGLIQPLLKALWLQCPEPELSRLLSLAPQVIRIYPEISHWVGPVSAASPHADPIEDRRLLHEALIEWIEATKGESRFAWLVDDLHRADNASLDALRAILSDSRIRHLWVVGAVGSATGVKEEAPALRRLMKLASRYLSLSELSEPLVGELLRSLFSIEPYPKLVQDISSAGLGNPALTLELLRDLVARNIIQYRDERWQLPRALADISVPQSLAEAYQRRLDELSAEALRVVRLVAIAERALPIEVIVAASELKEHEVFAALGDLRDLNLVEVRNEHRFGLVSGLPAAQVLAALKESERIYLHRRLGGILERSYGAAAKEHSAELAKHFYRGKSLFKAKSYLSAAGERLYEAQALSEACPLLEQLESLLVELGAERAPYGSELFQGLLKTRQQLARIGVAKDHALGDRMLEFERGMLLPELTALPSTSSAARRLLELSRMVGRGAISSGLTFSNLRDRIVQYVAATTYQTVLLGMKGEFARAEEVARTITPFILSAHGPARGAYATCRCITLTHQGLVARAEHFGSIALELYQDPALAKGFNEADVETGLGGVYTLMCVLYSARGVKQATHWIERFDHFVRSRAVERAWLRPNHLLAQLEYHLHRGEVRKVAAIERDYRALHAQAGGLNSQVEIKIMVALARARVAARDLPAAEVLCSELTAYPEGEWGARGWGSVVFAEVWRQQRLLGRAQAVLRQAFSYATRPGARCYKLEMRALNVRAEVELDLGEIGTAHRFAAQALELAQNEQTRSEYEEFWARRVLICVAQAEASEAKAHEHLEQLKQLVSLHNNPLFEAVYKRLLGEGVGVKTSQEQVVYRAAAERLFERLGYLADTLGGAKRGTGAPGSERSRWGDNPDSGVGENETVVAESSPGSGSPNSRKN